MIEFQDVTVCYEPDKRHPVRSLDGLSLKIERGDWVFLVGPSGAGKSSLLRLIYAGMKAQSGRVLVDGADISSIAARDVPTLRRKIGIVFQDFQLLSEKTAWENVAFALRVIGTPQSVIVREVPRALETVGLTHRADALPHELSGGEQQRIAIARAIVNNPPILLTDEPTGNLDPQTAREVGQLLTKINFERGTTIVMATHDGAFVDEMARRVVRLKAGRIVSDCNPGLYGDDSEPDAAPLPPQLKIAAPTIETVHPTIETVHPTVEIDGPTVEIDGPIVEIDGPTVEIDGPIVVIEKPTVEIEKPTTVPVSDVRVEATPPQVAFAVPSEPVVLDDAPLEEPLEMMVEPQKVETDAPVAAIPEPATETEKPVVSSGNWAQITAEIPVATPVAVPAKVAVERSDPYSVDGVQPIAAPRPMARRIAAPVPPPANSHALDPHSHVADPTAPLGSPENPIVQYDN